MLDVEHVSRPSTLSDAIFSVRLRSGVARSSLFGLLAAASSGRLVDLPAMAAYQRPAVVTVIAIIKHLLGRYSKADPESAQSLEEAWVELIGSESLRLTAPHDEVAFLQPATIEPVSHQSVQSADLLLPKVEHEVKQTWETTAERGLFALMGSMLRPNVKDHRTSTRTGMTALLTSNDGTLGDEILHLSSAYDALFGGIDGRHKMKDHMVWLERYSPGCPAIGLADIPLPFIDVGRAQRLVTAGPDTFQIWAVPNNSIRIEATADPWIEDPHTPHVVTRTESKRYKLAAKAFDHRFEHAVMFGAVREAEEIIRPRILSLTQYKVVRLCAIGTDQGKTKGYREATFMASRGADLFSLDEPSPDDRPARLSKRALSTIDAGRKILSTALVELFKDIEKASDVDWTRTKPAEQLFRSSVSAQSVQFVFDALSKDEDITREQQALDQFVAGAVVSCFEVASKAAFNPLKSARAELRLRDGIHFQLRGANMRDDRSQPFLARQTFAILAEMTSHLSPDDRARLRTMSLADPPLSFWKLLASVPEEQSEDANCISIWRTVLRAAGRVRHSRAPLGRILRETDFPDARVSRLLAATGPSLPWLLDEVGRWLISHDVEHANLAELATLGLGDALNDHPARDWARRSIALQFVRDSARPRAKATDSSIVAGEP